jgi:anaerobic selenocysteine-containing dehydrogenase
MPVKITKTICFECHSRCGVLLETKNNKLMGIKGDKTHPFSRGYVCPKGRACMEIIYHKERITHPLVKNGSTFQKTSWDHALDIISENLFENREKYGAESLVFGTGTTRGTAPYLNHFLTLFGSPNLMAPSNYSGAPLAMGSIVTSGFGMSDPDYQHSKCILLWAHNPEASWPGLYMHQINQALKANAKLIVIDPRGTHLARKADHWLQIRPGTDVALVLGFINIIIEKELYDKNFVEKYTQGFDQLKNHVAEFTPEKCSQITWIDKKDIENAAVAFAISGPAAIGPGMGGVCQANDAFDLVRGLTILSAITGNLDIRGGNINCSPPTRGRSCYGSNFNPSLNLSSEQAQKKLGIDQFPLMAFIPVPSPPETVWPAILEEKPYPVKAMGLFASNAMCAYANSTHVKQALSALDFLFCVDLFHTPTTEMADVILPPAHWTERDDVEDLLMKNHVFCQIKAVEPIDQCRDEKLILIDLARKLGLKEYWKTILETLDYRLEYLKISFEEFKQKSPISTPIEYQKYIKNRGFRTFSKKVELFSDNLKALGLNPLPIFREPAKSPVSTPDMYKEYNLILTTGGRNIVYYHSSHRNIASLHKKSPDPELQIHPKTAAKLGLMDGEWAYLVSPGGKVKIKIKFFKYIHQKVVHAPHGYWYGVKKGWEKININMITDNSMETLCPATGGVGIKAFLCCIRKIE